jgi:hypothetical protein
MTRPISRNMQLTCHIACFQMNRFWAHKNNGIIAKYLLGVFTHNPVISGLVYLSVPPPDRKVTGMMHRVPIRYFDHYLISAYEGSYSANPSWVE